MDELHKTNIMNNIKKLIETTDYTILVKKCKEKNIMSEKKQQNIEKDKDIKNWHNNLIIKITRCDDPSTYQKFIDICKEDFPDAFSILEPKTNGDSNNITTPQMGNDEFAPLTSEELSNLPRLFEIKPPETSYNPTYLNNECAGVLFFVNYTNNRPHANREANWIKSLFRELKFTIFYLENKEMMYVHECIVKLKKQYLKKVHCFFYLHLGVGTGSEVYFEDYSIQLSNIIDAFNHKNCGYMLNRQKVFIFPSIHPSRVPQNRNSSASGIKSFGVSDSKEGKSVVTLPDVVPTRSDNLIFHLEADIDSFEESIKVFCDCIKEYGYKEPLQNILKMYFNRRHRVHSDYREIIDEGCRNPFLFLYLDTIN